jgi:transposase
MFRFEPGLKVYLHREPVDGRKAINGLALLVEQSLGLNPFEPAIYVFSNRRRDRIKLPRYDHFWCMT